MARHDWVFAVSAGLCASLVPGCAQSLMQGSKWVGAPAPMRQRDTDVVPTPVASNNASPYHQLPKVAAAPAAAASEPYVAPVYSVTPMSRPEVVVQPPPVAETSVMDRESTQAKSLASAASTPVETKLKPIDDPPLVAAVRSIVLKRPSEAVAWLGRYDKASQDLLLCLLSLIARLSEGDLQAIDSGEASNMVTQLNQVAKTLRTHAALSIEKMCFCWHIEKFGVYRPLPADHEFRPGELVQVYVELQNFSSAAHGAFHSVRTASQMEIREFDGRIVWHLGFDDREHPDLSQTQRHDFFNNYSFHVPKIPPGLYTLWLQVMDVPTGRSAEHTLDFRVVPARGL